MGVTRFSGPVYGAKANLFTQSFAAGAISSGASTAIIAAGSAVVTPIYEQWVITELFVNVSTCSSNAAAFYLKFESPSWAGAGASGDAVSTKSGTIATLTSGTSTSISNFANPTTPTASEYEGFVVNPGSTLRLVSSANSAMGITQINVRGYTRYVDSTRAV